MKMKAGKKTLTPAAELALNRSITTIQSALQKASPRIRGQLDRLSDDLARHLDSLAPSLRKGMEEAGKKASLEAGTARRKVTANLAAAVEHLADEISRAPVPAGVEGFLGAATGNKQAVKDGQKAIVRAARAASKELRRSTRRTGFRRNAKIAACLLAAGVVTAALIKHSMRHFPEPPPAREAAIPEAGPVPARESVAGESPEAPS